MALVRDALNRRWLTLLSILLWIGAAMAEPHVVLVETADAPALAALSTQLQLYANRPLRITTLKEPAMSTAFAARASDVVVAHDATIVVWVGGDTTGPAERTLLVFAAGRWPGRAMIELVRIDAGTAPTEIERVVALKIAGLLDSATSPRPAGVSLGVPVSRETRGTSWRIELEASAVREAGTRAWDPRGGLRLEHAWLRGVWIYAAGATLYYQPTDSIANANGDVALYELGGGLSFAVERTLGRVGVFARASFVGSVVAAEGTSPTNARGSTTVLTPMLALDVGTRWPLSDNLDLVVGIGIEYATIQQRFLVDGVVIADLENVRGRAWLGLSLPLR